MLIHVDQIIIIIYPSTASTIYTCVPSVDFQFCTSQVDQAIRIICSAIANQVSWDDIMDLVRDAQAMNDHVAMAIKSCKFETNSMMMALRLVFLVNCLYCKELFLYVLPCANLCKNNARTRYSFTSICLKTCFEVKYLNLLETQDA